MNQGELSFPFPPPVVAPASCGCRVRPSANQNCSSGGSGLAVSFDTNDNDTNGFHSTTVNPTRITVPAGYGGLYLFVGQLEYQTGSAGIREAYIRKNGVDTSSGWLGYNTMNPLQTTNTNRIQVVVLAWLSGGDYMELMAFQSSGGTLTIDGGAQQTWFACAFLGG